MCCIMNIWERKVEAADFDSGDGDWTSMTLHEHDAGADVWGLMSGAVTN